MPEATTEAFIKAKLRLILKDGEQRILGRAA
jgi:hypothetical protein